MLSSSLLCIFIHIFMFTTSSSDPLPPLLVTRLVAPNSIYSPFSNPNNTISERANVNLKGSIYHASRFAINGSSWVDLKDLETELTPTQHGFLAYLIVGRNAVNQLVYMDTGSSLLWINCEPCGLNVPGPIFHPFESSSYVKEYCDDSLICSATGAVRIECYNNENKHCRYQVRYGSGQFSEGHLAREMFKFGKSAETFEMVFGCAKRTDLYANGVLGLGAGRLSILAQSAYSKFSYCIGNLSDRSYAYNTLVIGDRIKLKGYQTPVIVENRYYIILEGITVGYRSVKIDQDLFRRTSSYTGGMAVDTGSTFTFIPQTELNKLEVAVDDFIDENVERNESIYYKDYKRLCYDGHLSDVAEDFPTVRFRFRGDAIMELSIENLFEQWSETSYCLAILPMEAVGSTFSILGSRMQQYFYVAIDIRQNKLSFQRMSCDTIDRYIHDEL